ncbi:MAG: glycosyltransferase family 2 protein, partial [Bryobacteraceae bacterium]
AGLISIVLPAYNEEQNVRVVCAAIQSALCGLGPLELIFVDDGSSDHTADTVRSLRDEGAPVRLIRFGRNFGHQAALFAGLENAQGEAVITMDCDLQHPPELLPRMVKAWRDGAKVVQMVRIDTVDSGFFKSISSRLFYRFVNLLSETPVLSGAADYQLLDREVVAAILQFRDRHPFLRGIVGWLGFHSTCMEYVAAARHGGTSAYSLRKMVRLSIQAITGLSSKPLRFSFYLGVLTAVVALSYAAFALVGLVAGKTVPGWTSVIAIVAFLGAVQLVSIGIVGEYIARIYEQTRAMPRFVIVESDQSIPGLSDPAPAP